MSSAAASSWDTRVASGMMLALQCLMFLGFYFAVRHVESVACSAAQQLHSSLRTITLTPAPTLTPTPSHPHPHPPQAEYGHDFNIAFYNAYIGVTIMMLVGFGYLMAFLKCYGLGAVGFTFVITCLALQAHSRPKTNTHLHNQSTPPPPPTPPPPIHKIIPPQQLSHSSTSHHPDTSHRARTPQMNILLRPLIPHGKHLVVNSLSLLDGHFAAATVLISFGALIGKASAYVEN